MSSDHAASFESAGRAERSQPRDVCKEDHPPSEILFETAESERERRKKQNLFCKFKFPRL